VKYQIVIAGFGGQGVVFLVKVLAICAGNRDLKFLGTENHGMSQRGGSVRCDIKIGDFSSPVIDDGQANLLIGLDENEALRNLHLLREDSIIISNAQNHFPKLPIKVVTIDANQKALDGEFLVQALNVFMLGVTLKNVKNFPFSVDEVKKALTQMNPKLALKNIEVLEFGLKSR